jgi:ketosteroid isomerase-like protein
MIHRNAVFALFSAAVAVGALACARRKAEPERDEAVIRQKDEAVIRQKIETLVEAIRAMDLEKVMPIYAPNLVSFDIEPPLQHLGAEGKRKNWTRAFSAYEPPLGYEIRDLTITVGDDVAFVRSLAHVSGTLKNGSKSAYWVRWTTCLRKIDENWLIVHDQISVPLDFESGKAMLNLEP